MSEINHIKLPYAEQMGSRPTADRLMVGELWINGGDHVLGTKNQNGDVVVFAQFTEQQRQTLLSVDETYIPRTGAIENVSISYAPTLTTGTTITIDDSSSNTIIHTVATDNETININITNTTGAKPTYVAINKPTNLHCTIVWNGVDQWLSTQSEPNFGASSDAQSIAFAIFTDTLNRSVNVIYNTESPTDMGTNVWGSITGELENQTDLWNVINSKADTSVLDQYVPLSTYNELLARVEVLEAAAG